MAPVDLMRRYLTAAKAGDFDTAFGFLADDVVLHVPGRSRFAGELRGREAAVEYVKTARALSHGGEVELELVDMLASDERVALVVRERFSRDDGVVEIRRANVYTVRDDEIVEVWIFEANQYEVDELLG